MKYLTCIALAALIFIVAFQTGAAQESVARPYSLFAAGELGFMISPEAATDYYTKGFGISVGLEYPVQPTWSIVGFLNYKAYSPDEGMIADWWVEEGEYPGSTDIAVSEGYLSAFTVGFQGKGMLKQPTSTSWPYIKGGFGLSFAGADEIKVDYVSNGGSPTTAWQGGADGATNISVLLALGFEMGLKSTPRSLFAEIGYEIIMLEEGNNPGVVPIRFGVTF